MGPTSTQNEIQAEKVSLHFFCKDKDRAHALLMMTYQDIDHSVAIYTHIPHQYAPVLFAKLESNTWTLGFLCEELDPPCLGQNQTKTKPKFN